MFAYMSRVLHLRSSSDLLGAENVVLELASLSRNYGYDSVIGVIHDVRDPIPDLVSAAECRNIDFTIFTASSRVDFRCIRNIRRYILNNGIDIIHAHGYREDFYTLMARTGKKLCATNHLWKRTDITLMLYAYIDSIAISQFDHIIAVSHPIYHDMVNSLFIRRRKLSIISNGVDINKYKPGGSTSLFFDMPILNGKLVTTSISSLTTEKGHAYLLNALAAIKQDVANIHVLIVGDGPERENIEHLIAKLNLTDIVTLLGRRSDIGNILAATDVFVLPSLNEGLPMSLLEAMACGKPSIATYVGDINKCIVDQQSGILVKPKDSDALSGAIKTLYSDSKLRDKLGSAAASLIQRNFSNNAMARSYCKVYDQLMNVV
jgi:glycosyltransferase involved in cell wall biosynthesis